MAFSFNTQYQKYRNLIAKSTRAWSFNNFSTTICHDLKNQKAYSAQTPYDIFYWLFCSLSRSNTQK